MKQTSLRGIANKAANDKEYRFQNLFRMLTTGFLLWCWQLIRKNAASGVDRQDAHSYQQNLQENLEGLVEAIKGRRYRAQLVLRRYIPKPNGKLRPLGIPAIADKVLQMGVAKILEAICEQDFLGCSYGYRPKRGALDAVRDLSAALNTGKYHYLVEADIRGFFDNIDHDQLLKMLEKRIDDTRFLNLIRKWLKAGILETDGSVIHPATGTPQGGIVSPILANLYLHYVLDVWVQETATTHYHGAVYL
jgi:group II intron reverse transcriptase/maturase